MRASCAAGLEPIDPREDHLLDGRRDLHGDLVVETPAAALVMYQRARVGQRSDELLEEERVALGGLEDPPLDLGGQRVVADERVQQLAAGVAGQRLEGQLARPVRQLARRRLLHRQAMVVALRPRREDQKERVVLGVDRQQPQELKRGRVRPVEVLERDDDGAVDRQARRQRAHHLERAVLERLGRELGEAGLDVGLQREAEQRAEVRVDLGGAFGEQLVDVSAERHPHPQLRLVGQTPSHERRRSRNGQYGIDSP